MAAVCMSGSQVLSAAEDLSGGIVVCGYRFEDMMYDELRQCLSSNFEMLVLASPAKVERDTDVRGGMSSYAP